MKRRTLSLIAAVALALPLAGYHSAAAAQELRVLVHSSFELPKPLLAEFEADAGIKLSILKGGDAGEMLNKLILTRAKPIADVVYGLDNTLVGKALVTLNANDGSTTLSTTQNAYITVLPNPGTSVPVVEGFETVANLTGPEWFTSNPNNDNTFGITSVAAYSGSNSTRIVNSAAQAGRIESSSAAATT